MKTCKVCGEELEPEACFACLGEGGWHDCGEDCCCCLEPWPNVPCDECAGEGTLLVCPALPHTDEQLLAYRRELMPGPGRDHGLSGPYAIPRS